MILSGFFHQTLNRYFSYIGNKKKTLAFEGLQQYSNLNSQPSKRLIFNRQPSKGPPPPPPLRPSAKADVTSSLNIVIYLSIYLIIYLIFIFIYFFDRERAVSWQSCNLIGSGSGQYFPISDHVHGNGGK